jgi:fructose-1-phosphate kinase PfkB-like protein
MKRGVTVTMNPAVDASSATDRVAADRKLRCGPLEREPGGGINVARAMGKLGGEALALHAAGGPMGELLAELLDHEPLRHQRIRIAGSTRENVTIRECTPSAAPDAPQVPLTQAAKNGSDTRNGLPGASSPSWRSPLMAWAAADDEFSR